MIISLTSQKNCKNEFWKDVLNEWQKVIKSKTTTLSSENSRNNIDNTLVPVWYNSYIKINNKSVFFKDWYEKGIKYIDDFLDEDGKLLKKDKFSEKYSISVNIMQYNSICSAISKYLRTLTFDSSSYEQLTRPSIPFYFNFFFSNMKPSKCIYNLLSNSTESPTCFVKWKNELPFVPDKKIKDAFITCFKITLDSSIQWLQFRILHRILATNSYLKKIKIKNCDLCTLCNSEPETIIHIFLQCPHVMPIWTSLSLHIFNTTSKRIGFNIENIIFGEEFNRRNIVVNFIILNAKQYFYTNFKKAKNPTLQGLVLYLKYKYNVERCIWIFKGKLQTFVKIWREYINIFELA